MWLVEPKEMWPPSRTLCLKGSPPSSYIHIHLPSYSSYGHMAISLIEIIYYLISDPKEYNIKKILEKKNEKYLIK